VNQLLNNIPSLIFEEDNANILKPISEEEVRTVVFSMGPFKALGPDGFPSFSSKNFGTL